MVALSGLSSRSISTKVLTYQGNSLPFIQVVWAILVVWMKKLARSQRLIVRFDKILTIPSKIHQKSITIPLFSNQKSSYSFLLTSQSIWVACCQNQVAISSVTRLTYYITILANQLTPTDLQIKSAHQISAYLRTGVSNSVPREVATVAHYIVSHYKRPDPVQLVETSRTISRFQSIELLQYPSDWILHAFIFWKTVKLFRDNTRKIWESNGFKQYLEQYLAQRKANDKRPTINKKSPITIIDPAAFQRVINNTISKAADQSAAQI